MIDDSSEIYRLLKTTLDQVNSTDDRGTFTCVLDEEQYSKKNVSVIVLDLHPSFSGVVVADQGDTVKFCSFLLCE